MTQLVTTTRTLLVKENIDEVFDLFKKEQLGSFIELIELTHWPSGEGFWERKINVNTNHIVEINY